MISPYDRDLINEGSETRRKFIDTVISQFNKLYLDDLIKYNKALLQRNSLLKRFAEQNYFDVSSLEIWDEKLIYLSEKIFQVRNQFLEQFEPLFQHYFKYITNGKEAVEIKYDSNLSENSLRALLAESLEKDRITKYTNVGIHKDDLVFHIENFPVKKFGSQGQQKSFVVALKLAQFDYTKNVKGFKPILLLDDIFDKLDEIRVRQIIQLVSENNFGQTFITDTQQERVEHIFEQVHIDHHIFEIIDGKSIEIKNTNLTKKREK
jgi:DNA replication and repair protein RecF